MSSKKIIDDSFSNITNDIQRVQTKPTMYISYTGNRAFLHLTHELVNNVLDEYKNANERLQYWFTKKSYIDLLKLYQAIEITVDNKKYRDAFECIFSAILKACSKWLTKSIKPLVRP